MRRRWGNSGRKVRRRNGDAEVTGVLDTDESVELVIGVSSAVGTPDDRVFEVLRDRLRSYGYLAQTIKISALLQDEAAARGAWPMQAPRPDERIELLIQEGNELCQAKKDGGYLAVRTVDEIVRMRGDTPPSDPGSVATNDDPTATSAEQGRLAFIVDSLKRPDEVERLREGYGDRFLLLGLVASADTRRAHLTARFAPTSRHDGGNLSAQIDSLMKRDDAEGEDFGQDVAKTMKVADVFIDVEEEDGGARQVERAVDLLFGDPSAGGPTNIEFGMQVATQTSARSPELGLHVGAALLSATGDVLAVGSNHHPTATEQPAYDASQVDVRATLRELLDQMSEADLLSQSAKTGLAADGELYTRDLLDGQLRGTRLRALTEYQRPIHAEMDALLSALRQGVSVEGAQVCVSAFPCHNCAKHLIGVGIHVTYLEPYPKSLVGSMFGEHSAMFKPFIGVAPSRYVSWFIDAKAADRKDKTGVALKWEGEERRDARPWVSPGVTRGYIKLQEDFVRRVVDKG